MLPSHKPTNCLGKRNYVWAGKTIRRENQDKTVFILKIEGFLVKYQSDCLVMARPPEGSKETLSSPAWELTRSPWTGRFHLPVREGRLWSREGISRAGSALAMLRELRRNEGCINSWFLGQVGKMEKNSHPRWNCNKRCTDVFSTWE